MDIVSQHVLVVDNDPFFIKLFSEYLSRDGHTVISASNAFQCLDILSEVKPDIIFLDLIMPHLGGEELCRIIRNHKHLQDVYVVIISAVALEKPIDVYAFGADACIAKGPFKEIQFHIREVIREAQNPRKEYPLQQLRGAEGLYSRNITRELLQQIEHLRMMLQNMSQGILEIVAERVIYANRSALEMLNTSADALLGAPISSALPLPLLETLKKENCLPGEFKRIHQKMPVQFNDHQFIVEEFSLSGDQPGKLLILSDITERKRMESVIEAANLTENLGYVFSGIRHEIGNPVNSIKMALSVLQRNLSDYDHKTIAEFLDRSLAEISRIEYLLKALKNYSLFESPVVQNIPVSAFLRDFVALIRNDFQQLNIQISTIIADDELVVCADARALHHVMLNLLTNAADALDKTENPRIAISCYKSGNMVVIKVDDNGKGIPEADLQHLFKPFFTTKTTGTGLGLAIVRKLLTAMHGFITVESYQTVGTTITLILPESQDEAQPENAPDH